MTNITAFNGIFEARLLKLLKQIKDLSKNKKSNKEQIKSYIKEAKRLRDAIKKEHKKTKSETTISFTIKEQYPDTLVSNSNNVSLQSISCEDGEITYIFNLL